MGNRNFIHLFSILRVRDGFVFRKKKE